MKHYIFALSLFLISSLSVYAQGDIEMATGLRSSGKIWVVVLVLLIVFFGIAAYLFALDRKVSKLEKNNR